MSVLQIFLFGRFRVQYGEIVLTSFQVRKAQELLCYLLLHRGRPHYRESLCELLWYDVSATQARQYLRKTLWQLQTALDTQMDMGKSPLLVIEPDWIEINLEADFWLDVMAFEEAFTQVRGTPGDELDSRRAQMLQQAVNMYQGILLEGWYTDWCLDERERLQHIYLAILDKLTHYCERQGNYEAGIAYGRQALMYDRARERTHRQLMYLQYLAGYRTGALRQYDRCRCLLKQDLNVRPTQKTVRLYEQICADQTNIVSTRSVFVTEMTLSDMLNHLQRIQTNLSNFQQQVQQDIQAIKRIIEQ